jgi:transcriptional regulator with XRE-family HTH domain
MDRVQSRLRAINLRESGFSYNEILKEIKVPKSTLAYWLRGIPLDDKQTFLLKARVLDRQKRGRFSTAIALRARRVYREKAAYDSAEKEFREYARDRFFVLGVTLYWAGGGKGGSHFQFVNSDPEMIHIMIRWAEKYLKMSKKDFTYRLFINESHKDALFDDFWAKNIGIKKDMIKKTLQKRSYNLGVFVRNNPQYKGSLRININRIFVLRKVLAWQNLLIKYYKDTQ